MIHLARFLSAITNPLVLLFIAPYILLAMSGMGSLYALKWTLFSFFFVFLTGVFIFYEVKRGVFSDFDVSKREQRPLLFMVSTLLTSVYFVSLYIFNAPPILFATVFGIMVAILLISIINTKVKASIHVATNTAIILTFILVYEAPIYLLLLIPIIAWARIQIKRHTFRETIVGAVLGSSVTGIMYLLLKFGFHFTI